MDSLLTRKELSFVFVGGKGGVGKTTSSAAIAIQFSYDRKVLLLSTDPAHSLSDAFRLQFSGTPQKVSPNLEVMEVNPETALRSEIEKWTAMASESGFDDLIENVKEFQEWLLGIPGIDEATALANVIGYIESGQYDVIVFDTAPTGHTLKLLNLPKVLQLGLDKLAGWQSKLWGVWQVVKGKGNPAQMQKTVSDRLLQYKKGVEKIAVMLQDNTRTNFTVVCIAEHLSINESCRLLAELKKNGVGVSHVIVNQLVTQALQTEEFPALDALLARCTPSPEEELLLQRVRASIQLTNARRNIQQKYLRELSSAPEAQGLQVVEVPLLPSEVTGYPALLNFSQRLVPSGFRPSEEAPGELVGWVPHPAPLAMPSEEKQEEKAEAPVAMQDDVLPKVPSLPPIGSSVSIHGLAKAPQYNGMKGKVVSHLADGRVGVTVGTKTISFQPSNLTLEASSTVSATEAKAATIHTSGSPASDPKAALEARLLADPEVVEALKKPKFKAAFDDIKANPAKLFTYMTDPELGPFCSKMMAKMMKPS